MDKLALTVAVGACLTLFAAESSEGQPGQNRAADIGVILPLSDPPKTLEWLYVFDALMGAQGREGVISADATICMQADEGVAEALLDLYGDPRFSEFKNIIARPFAGFRQKGAQDVSLRVVKGDAFSPNESIFLEAARSVLRTGGEEGLRSVIEKIDLWGELPKRDDIEDWVGMGICEVLSEPRSPDSRDMLLSLLEQRTLRSGGRLAVCCALFGEQGDFDRGRVNQLIQTEMESTVKDSLKALISTDPNEMDLNDKEPENEP